MEDVRHYSIRVPFRHTDHIDHTVTTQTAGGGGSITVSSYIDIVLKPLTEHVNVSEETWGGKQALAVFALTMTTLNALRISGTVRL